MEQRSDDNQGPPRATKAPPKSLFLLYAMLPLPAKDGDEAQEVCRVRFSSKGLKMWGPSRCGGPGEVPCCSQPRIAMMLRKEVCRVQSWEDVGAPLGLSRSSKPGEVRCCSQPKDGNGAQKVCRVQPWEGLRMWGTLMMPRIWRSCLLLPAKNWDGGL